MFASENSLLKAVILATGRELLTGRVRDTNSGWLCEGLFGLGVRVIRVVTVDDDPVDMTREFSRAVQDGADVIITTGGLGPTPDDMTIRCIAAAAGVPVARSDMAFGLISGRYADLVNCGRLADPSINEDRAHMADMPLGATVMPNRVGTAPGADFVVGGVRVFCLPGPPPEMTAMACESVLPQIARMVHGTLARRTIELPVFDESHVASLIRGLLGGHPDVHFKPEPGVFDGRRVMRVHLETAADCRESAAVRLEQAAAALRKAADPSWKA
ncbi:MAG TPA: competence/damage-inducible protein A [Myxococcota bacterium]|nr:competence/damage-inducible protein A [Myxococcota bacterium]